ncbi:MAG: hypothetical protein ACTS8R_08990 [Arsenophonus sp. NC-QC1-MAG3]
MLTNRIPLCVDKTVYMKANFLTVIAKGKYFTYLHYQNRQSY